MKNRELGRLERVKLRDIWGNESTDFTPWLVHHIQVLGETLDMDLEVTGQEEPIGPYSADIVCRDIGSEDDATVLIENQLEKTDHKHLGQLLTYASGLEAVAIIWVAEHFSEEHRAALDWLNKITGEGFRFFGLEIELWQIGDSPPAPRFNIVCKPNQWSKVIRQRQEQGSLSDTRQIQFRYWTALKEDMEKHGSLLRCRQPAPNATLPFPIGKSGVYFMAGLSSWSLHKQETGKEVRVGLVVDGENALDRFGALEEQKDDIESELGEELIWYAPKQTRRRRIYLRRSADYTDESEWPNQHTWLREKLDSLNNVLRHRVAELE